MFLVFALLFGSSLCPDTYTVDSATPAVCIGRAMLDERKRAPYDYTAFGRVTFGQLADAEYDSSLSAIVYNLTPQNEITTSSELPPDETYATMFPQPDLLNVFSGDVNEITITQPKVDTTGGKTYTVITGKNWTCTPTTLTKSSATLVCIKSDTSKENK